MTDNSTTDAIDKIGELIHGVELCMLTTVDADGTLTSRPMAQQERDFDGDLWFIIGRDSRKTSQINGQPQVNVTFSSGSTWVSVSGSADLVVDRAKLEELWDPSVTAWFPEGPDDPNIVLLRVAVTGAEYWDTPGGRVATLLSLAKAKVTGQPYSGGENETLDL